VRLALLAVAACVGLTGCATIGSWFAPSTPPQPARAEQPEEPARRVSPPPTASPPVSSPPRAAPPVLGPPRPATPAPAPPPVPVEAPPPVLSPVLSAVDEQRLRAEAQQRIDGAEQRLRQIDQAKLGAAQQDSLQTVQSFLDKARETVQTQDVQRAFTLADKAYLLADELVKRPR
jgi:type IV secretory pathway VirB10-like protein